MKHGETGPGKGRWRRLGLALVVVSIVAAGASACGGDSKKATATAPAATAVATKPSADISAMHQVFQAAQQKWNAKDLEGFVALFTDKGLISSFGGDGQTVAQAREGLQQFFGTVHLGNPQFSQESVSGNAGTMDTVFEFGPTLLHSKFTLAKSGNVWKLDGEESNLPVDVPAGATAYNVDLTEFAFGANFEDIAGAKGVFAIVANNVGRQGHEIGIARIAADANVADLVKQAAASDTGADPPGVQFVGGTSAEPGQKSNLVFAKPLDPGRYIMVCFRPDTGEGPNGTAHALKGMVQEFTVK